MAFWPPLRSAEFYRSPDDSSVTFHRFFTEPVRGSATPLSSVAVSSFSASVKSSGRTMLIVVSRGVAVVFSDIVGNGSGKLLNSALKMLKMLKMC